MINSEARECVLQEVVFPDGVGNPEDEEAPIHLGRAREALYWEAEGDGAVEVISRRQVRLAEWAGVSFGTYFNAFCAGYWTEFTALAEVGLRLRMDAPADVQVFRSSAEGEVWLIGEFNGATAVDLRIGLASGSKIARAAEQLGTLVGGLSGKVLQDSLGARARQPKGGWIWFQIQTGAVPVTLREAAWVTVLPADFPSPTVDIGITTMNKPEFVVQQLQNFSAHRDDLNSVRRIYIVDQGSDLVRERLAAAAAALDAEILDKLRIIEQPNLGGSGGFSRAMYEFLGGGAEGVVDSDGSDFLILLDDDTFLETETIRRAVMFAALARRPTVVGGQMFDLNNPSVLNGYAEVVDERTTWWGPAPGTVKDFDFAESSLARTLWLHRVYRPDFNGWWMCLIPRVVLQQVGLSLPFFIKWDDAEFGLRAKRAGFEVVSLPGFGIWHQTWDDKSDARNWQSFYHWRNRLVVALFYNPKYRPTALLRWLLVHDLFALLSLRYSAVRLHLEAIVSLWDGPEGLFADLGRRLALIREVQRHYLDAAEFAFSADDFPAGTPVVTEYAMSRLRKIFCLLKSAVNQCLPSPDPRSAMPKLIVHTRPIRWIRVAAVDSAIVVTPDGRSAVKLVRSRTEFWKLFGSTWKIYLKLFRKWPALRKLYRQSTGSWVESASVSVPRQLASFQNWQTLFSETASPPKSSRKSSPKSSRKSSRKLFRKSHVTSPANPFSDPSQDTSRKSSQNTFSSES